jgi:hypothetical protein
MCSFQGMHDARALAALIVRFSEKVVANYQAFPKDRMVVLDSSGSNQGSCRIVE